MACRAEEGRVGNSRAKTAGGWTPGIWDHVLWVGLRRWMSFLQCLAEVGLGLLCGSNWFPRESKANFSLAPRDTSTCGIENRGQHMMCEGLSFGRAIPTPEKEEIVVWEKRNLGDRNRQDHRSTSDLCGYRPRNQCLKGPCTCPQEEVLTAAVIVSQKVWFPAMDLDQWVLTSSSPRIPFIVSSYELPENPIIYIIAIVLKLHEPPNATTLNFLIIWRFSLVVGRCVISLGCLYIENWEGKAE